MTCFPDVDTFLNTAEGFAAVVAADTGKVSCAPCAANVLIAAAMFVHPTALEDFQEAVAIIFEAVEARRSAEAKA